MGVTRPYNQKILLPDSATVSQAAALSAGLRGITGGTEALGPTSQNLHGLMPSAYALNPCVSRTILSSKAVFQCKRFGHACPELVFPSRPQRPLRGVGWF